MKIGFILVENLLIVFLAIRFVLDKKRANIKYLMSIVMDTEFDPKNFEELAAHCACTQKKSHTRIVKLV